MAGRDLETIIRISGEMDANLRKAIERAASSIGEIREASARASDAMGVMSDVVSEQGNALKAAKKKYASYVLEGDEATEQAKELAKQIKAMTKDLNKNKKAISAAEKAADDLAHELDDVGDAARDTEGGFTVMKGAMANLVSGGISSLISAAGDAMSTIYGLADSTQEYREDMGKLETAWESAGKSTELATKTYKEFYSVLGEEDRSVEAVNHLAKFVNTEKDMAKWTDIATGVWGTFGDSLPIEGLTEASNEVSKSGKLTGVLVDALVWAGIEEEAFQKKLDSLNSEQERAALITQTLSGAYSKAAKNYKENNKSIIAARKANSDYTDTMAEIGEKIEPVTTAVKEGFTGILEKALELASDVDVEMWVDRIGDAFEFAADAMDGAAEALAWVKDNADWLIPVVGGLTAALVTYKAATVAMTIAEGIKAAVLATGAGAVTAATVATWAFNAAVAFLTSPLTIIIAIIAALTAGVIWLYNNWDVAKEKLLSFGQKVGEVWTSISNWVTGAIDKIGEHFPMFGAFLSGWWESIQAAVDNVKKIFSGIIDFIGNVFAGNWSDAWGNIVDIFGNIFGLIGNLVKAPINGIISVINYAIGAINKIGFDIPDWVPLIGGSKFSINIPEIPMLATGGFTEGVSIAGEAGTEAVISFDSAYREANIGYWAKAGRMLGATAEDAGFSLSGSSGGTTIDMGGVTFAPNINISGKADKESVIKAIRAEYPEFLDLLEEFLVERGVTVYA